jgi:hypothetical protein
LPQSWWLKTANIYSVSVSDQKAEVKMSARPCFFFPSFVLFFVVLGIKARATPVLGKHSTTELQPQLQGHECKGDSFLASFSLWGLKAFPGL